MSQTFYFYDLETSGLNPRSDRIMQFAGQRTTLDLERIGKPYSTLITLTADILPSPEAIVVTGITPQQTLKNGLTEAEFLAYFHKHIATPQTIFVGFNSVRFDDEFMRYIHYRNLYDPYEWQWQAKKSKWDLLDVLRMTRALRPDGIKWPVNSSGAPSNDLVSIAALNHIDHHNAHDALSDVHATIDLARLMLQNQPNLFRYMLHNKDKLTVSGIVNSNQPFVYTSGKYTSEFAKTSVAVKLADHPNHRAALVYDLRFDPTEFLKLTPDQLVQRWRYTKNETAPPRLPVKTLRFNVCPAVAPLSVLDEVSQQRLSLNLQTIERHLAIVQSSPTFKKHVLAALDMMDQEQAKLFATTTDVDSQLYEDFYTPADKRKLAVVRNHLAHQKSDPTVVFTDTRLRTLLPLYKARNYPQTLSTQENVDWQKYRSTKLLSGGEKSQYNLYKQRLTDLSRRPGLTHKQQLILEELRSYGEYLTAKLDDALSNITA